MATLEQEKGEEQSSDQLSPKTISHQIEIIEEILSRAPVKTLIRFNSVSKPWLSLISEPSFAKLHFTRTIDAASSGLFISAYDKSTRKRHFLSASHDGGVATRLLTLSDAPSDEGENTEAEHLNGLVLFTSQNGFLRNNFSFLFNPSTRKFFKLPVAAPRYNFGRVHICYLFGFDDVSNEHKILKIEMLGIKSLIPFKPTTVEFAIFSLVTYTWRKIDVDLPIDISGEDWYYGNKQSVCVNGVIHLMLQNKNEILAFDLKTEKFSIMQLPPAALPSELDNMNSIRGHPFATLDHPILMKINGVLVVICHEHVADSNAIDIWILEDYKNQVWVKDTITFPAPFVSIGCPFPLDSTPMGEIIFTPYKPLMNVIKMLVYDLKKRTFRSAEVTLDHKLSCSESVGIDRFKSYVESIIPLKKNETEGEFG